MNKLHQAIFKESRHVETPFYIYDQQTILDRIRDLKENFHETDVLFSIKANPYPAVVKTILRAGVGADAASWSEVDMAVAYGLSKDEIYYSAPAKSQRALESALPSSVLTADSMTELERIEALAEKSGETVDIALRINPDFTMFEDQGRPSKFGIDEEQVLAAGNMLAALKHVRIIGLHIHVATQILDEDRLVAYYDKVLRMARNIKRTLGLPLCMVNMGGGIGIPYQGEAPLGLASLGKRTDALARAAKADLGLEQVFIETGRFLVCESGYYVAKIVDIKVSHGTKFLFVQNTLNGFLRPAIAQMIGQYTSEQDNPPPNEPYFTGKQAFGFSILGKKNEPKEAVTIGGHLCTAADIIARDVMLPAAQIGDVLIVDKAGAYGYGLSPVRFSGHPGPYQVMMTTDGDLI